MTWTKAARLSAAAGLIVCAGCAAASAGSGRDASPNYFRTIGAASANDLAERGSRVMRQFGYAIRREQGPPLIEIESEWKLRRPFADEREDAIENAQTRVILRGRERSSPGSLPLFNVEVNVENKVQVMGSNEWTFIPMSPLFRMHADSLASELERELRNLTRQ